METARWIRPPARRPAGPLPYHAPVVAMDERSEVGRAATPSNAAPALVDATEWPSERWDRLAVGSAAGHAFQSHAWGELKRPLGWTPRRFIVEAGGEPVAAVSFQERSLAPRLPGPLAGFRYLYAPRGPILLGESPAAARAALDGLREAARERRAAILTIDPAWPADGPLATELARAGFGPAARDVQVSRTATPVPLFADEAEQHRLVRKSTANLINRARREGASVERIDLANADPPERDRALRKMHDLLVATARREGLELRGRDYQLAQWRALGEAGIAWLSFARVKGERWAGSVLLRCGQTLHQFQAGSADEADLRAVPANHLLQWEIMRWAASEGFTAYDMGGVDTARAPGVPRDERHPLWNLYLFKRGFGAKGVAYLRAHEYSPNPLVRAAWRLARQVR